MSAHGSDVDGRTSREGRQTVGRLSREGSGSGSVGTRDGPRPARGRGRRPSDSPVHLVQLATVATRHYRDGHTKSDIADDLGISRFKVARLLDEALERGLVRIEILMPPSPLDIGLSTELARRFGLRHAYVLSARGLPEDLLRRELGAVASSVVAELIDDASVVGIAWGRTLDMMADALPDLPPCAVVQIVGGMPAAGISVNSLDLVRRLGRRAGGSIYSLHAPLIAPDAATAKSLREDPQVAGSLEMFDRLTCAIVAVGSWDRVGSLMAQSLSDEDRERLADRGVVADIAAALIGADGTSIVTSIDERRIAISEAELRAVPEVVAVAGGVGKIGAIRAVLTGRWVTSLVTDADVAEALCRED